MLAGPRPTILIVDDDDQTRHLVSLTLANANYDVLEARGGLEGIATMLRYDGEIALAVLEIKMPGINGLDLANQIGIERPNTGILYISSATESIAVDCLTRTAPDAVLAKPFTGQQLLDRIQKSVFRKRAKASPGTWRSGMGDLRRSRPARSRGISQPTDLQSR